MADVSSAETVLALLKADLGVTHTKRDEYFAALIAVNLAVMNLLPLPALDGGRIFFLLVDAVSMALFKRKVPEKYQAAINTAGFVLLMGFMLLVTFQDVFKLVK